MEKTRAQFLAETLESDPANAFVRYALAMELSNSEELSPAWRHFEHLLTHQPEYLATYYQAGKFLAKACFSCRGFVKAGRLGSPRQKILAELPQRPSPARESMQATGRARKPC